MVKKKRTDFQRIVIGLLIGIILLLLLKNCEGGCDRFNYEEENDTTTTTIPESTSTTTTTMEEFTCGETLQGVCEGSCPEGQSCERIVQLFGETCKCVEVQR